VLLKKSFLKVEGNTGAKEAAEKIEEHIPRGLKAAKDDKNKRLRRWPEGQLYQKTEFFSSPPWPAARERS
jgi:hypothetical protein